ncbi:MAG: GtrA family protein [Acidobacteriia bacterium]|nr:GtrA family protein [Terriglobia bacterium]
MIRWFKFNAVGMAGVVVQLAALSLLTSVFRVPYLFATALAVELALLHNFVWHEAWTWRGLAVEDRWRRLARFHLANGFVSIGANTLFTYWFKQHFGLPLLSANLAAIAATSLLNFAVATWWVFRTQAR